jgi:NAD+ diphosphatase
MTEPEATGSSAPASAPTIGRPTLSRAGVDRAAHLRSDDAALAAAWADGRARVVRVHDSTVPLVAASMSLALVSPAELTGPQAEEAAERYFLGVDPAGVPYFAVAGPFVPGDTQRAAGFREIGSHLPDLEAGLFVHAVGLANWHARHRFCPQCGASTLPTAGGHVRLCTGCGAQQFPRCDPAVIMLVVDDDDRALLGHNPAWPPGRFSTLAGFVEPGESLEQAVTREVFEEVGVVVDDVRYEGSQPWPFPSSLMLGFKAHAVDPALRIDAVEITEARWFSRDELVDAGRRREVLMPSSVSIARWLVERWFGGPLPADNVW